MAQLKKIYTQATKTVVKRIKTAAEKAESNKVKKAKIIQNNVKKTLTKKKIKDISKKREMNEMPNTGTATQGDDSQT